MCTKVLFETVKTIRTKYYMIDVGSDNIGFAQFFEHRLYTSAKLALGFGLVLGLSLWIEVDYVLWRFIRNRFE